MNEKKSFETIFEGNIILKNSMLDKISYDEEKLEKTWNEFCKKKNDQLFNDRVLTYIDSFQQNDELVINAGFVDYKIVVSSRIEPDLGLNLQQIGVSGITIIHENDSEYVLFSSRSSKTTEYPNFLELVPSGNIDESALKNDGYIDYSSKLIGEFVEETGLNKSYIQKIEPKFLVFDKKNQVYDVCCRILISDSRNHIIEAFQNVSEYEKPILIPLNSLSEFVSENFHKIVPTSLAILSNIMKK